MVEYDEFGNQGMEMGKKMGTGGKIKGLGDGRNDELEWDEREREMGMTLDHKIMTIEESI